MATRPTSAAATIRPAREADLDDVAGIERDVFADPWTRRSFADLVTGHHVEFLVAAQGKEVVGYAIVLISGVESELANLAVAKVKQQHGLGTKLLDEAKGAARRRGCQEMFLEVRESNKAAISLYTSEGFQAVGRRARYYARPIEDAIVMRAVLS